jgi:molybdopterin-guanine dinucleotide biosynthesis protein A
VPPELSGLLLTGGAGRRLGRDKALLPIGEGGEPLARTLGRSLAAVTGLAVEVGPGHSGLAVPDEADPGEGPLVAIAAGWSYLLERGRSGPVLVLATDLPRLSPRCLGEIASWPAPDGSSVVPVLRGRLQPLCARWSAGALGRAAALVARGERRVEAALEQGSVLRLTEDDLARCSPPIDAAVELADVDVPGDLRRLGLDLDGGFLARG